MTDQAEAGSVAEEPAGTPAEPAPNAENGSAAQGESPFSGLSEGTRKWVETKGYKSIEDAITSLKSAVEASEPDADDIQAKTQTLMEVSMKLGQAIYEAQQAEASEGPEGGNNDDGVVDADYEEIKDDKKSA